MDVMEAIRGRRTVHGFTAEPVTRAQIEAMLEAAVWAPNHKLSNPWEFYVISGEAKERLARLRGELKQRKHANPDSPEALRSYANAYGEMALAPYAILVCQQLAEEPTRREEDLLAVGCAIQNMMLAAYSMGVGTFWGTGPLASHPETFRLLGVPEGRRSVGLILVGYPAEQATVPAREPAAAKTRWVTAL